MKRIYVESSSIKSIGYDIIQRILEVEFKNGSIYNYYEIPQYNIQRINYCRFSWEVFR